MDRQKLNERKRREYHNRKKQRCLHCDKITTRKFCDNKCQNDYQNGLIFTKIENGTYEPLLSLGTTNRWYKKYLIQKYGEKCMECSWCIKNTYSGKIPIELEHIDGNSENFDLKNLKLLCPNCHSLTPTFKALNMGNGRHSRRIRYKEGKSF